MERGLKVVVAVCASLTAAGSTFQEPFPDSPENHWAYEAALRFKRAGLIATYDFFPGDHNRPVTRNGFASGIQDIVEDSKKRWLRIDDAMHIGEDPNSLSAKQYVADLKLFEAFVAHESDLKRLLSTFDVELMGMGGDTRDAKDWLHKAKFLLSIVPYKFNQSGQVIRNELPPMFDDSEYHYIFEGLSEMKKVGVKVRKRGMMNYSWSRPEIAVAAYDVFKESQRRWIILKLIAEGKGALTVKEREEELQRQLLWARVFEGWSHGFRATMREFSSELKQMGLDSVQAGVWIMKTAEEMRALPFGIGKRS